MHKIIAVKPLPGYRVWIRFSDDSEGEVDLADLVGKGVFSIWNNPETFKKVSIDPEMHTLVWPGGIDICPDSLYEDLTGIKVFSGVPHLTP